MSIIKLKIADGKNPEIRQLMKDEVDKSDSVLLVSFNSKTNQIRRTRDNVSDMDAIALLEIAKKQYLSEIVAD